MSKIYARIEDGLVVEYPVYEDQIRQKYPEILFPSVFCPPEGWVSVNIITPKFDPNIEDIVESLPIFSEDEWHQSWKVVPREYSQDSLENMFKEEKSLALKQLNRSYSEAVNAFIGKYPLYERESWSSQVEEATAILANVDTPTPWIDAAARARGVDRVVLAQKILEKNLAFREISGKYSGIRQRLEDQIDAISEVTLDNIVLLKTIQWPKED